jgi:hypothetical protein
MIKEMFMAIPLLLLLAAVIFLLLQELRVLNKRIRLVKRAEKNNTNMLYEYLQIKLVNGLCMDNSIEHELRCMSNEDIVNIIIEGGVKHD